MERSLFEIQIILKMQTQKNSKKIKVKKVKREIQACSFSTKVLEEIDVLWSLFKESKLFKSCEDRRRLGK